MDDLGDVSTHAPLAGSDGAARRDNGLPRVSTHAPLAGSDALRTCSVPTSSRFNPRSPCGERPALGVVETHSASFNPRSPYGERRQAGPRSRRSRRFNPRSPCGERRPDLVGGDAEVEVSTHAPLAGSDRPRARPVGRCRVSTHAPLAGSGRRVAGGPGVPRLVSTHAPLAGSDCRPWRGACGTCAGFNPRSPCGERRKAKPRLRPS